MPIGLRRLLIPAGKERMQVGFGNANPIDRMPHTLHCCAPSDGRLANLGLPIILDRRLL